MSQHTRLYANRLLLSSFACALCLTVAGGLSACKTVDVGDDTVQDTLPKDTAKATLRITNSIRLFQDSLDFFLFPATADFSTASGGRAIGGVGVGKTGVFKVPAAMRSLDTDDWVKSSFAKDGDYSLILSSDGQDIRWNPTFPTDPSLN
jgi:hypothetical protein